MNWARATGLLSVLVLVPVAVVFVRQAQGRENTEEVSKVESEGPEEETTLKDSEPLSVEERLQLVEEENAALRMEWAEKRKIADARAKLAEERLVRLEKHAKDEAKRLDDLLKATVSGFRRVSDGLRQTHQHYAQVSAEEEVVVP